MHSNIRYLILLLFCALHTFCNVQAQSFLLSGKVIDPKGHALELASVTCLSQGKATMTNLKGEFSLSLQTEDSVVVRFSMVGYKTRERIFRKPKGKLKIEVHMAEMDELGEVVVTETRRQTTQMQNIDSKDLKRQPSTTGNAVEELIQQQAGVSTHSEMSSQYNVRGGSFDENVVYINNVEVYRPLLIRSGQQEGLSIINADMVDKIGFSTGGFEAKYGDKMSSALDITYRKPRKFEANAQGSLLGGSAFIATGGKTFSMSHGLRYKTNRYLLGSLETEGEYKPNFLDYQTYISFNPNDRWTLDFIGNVSSNHYNFTPSSRETSFGTMENVKQFKVYFDGWEKDVFTTLFGTVGLTRSFTKDTKVKFLFSSFYSKEKEAYDIQGQYWLTDTQTSEQLGVGTYMEHARNFLTSKVQSYKLMATHRVKKHSLEAGVTWKHEKVKENSREYEFRDSAGYSIPHTSDRLDLIYSLRSKHEIKSDRIEAYLQDTYRFTTKKDSGHLFTLNYGVRLSNWSYNKETIVSPRVSLAMVPAWNTDMTFRLAAGLYYQAPFFKELRDTVMANGLTTVRLNEKIKSQKSVQFVGAFDYRFKLNKRPFRFSAEAYYKALSNLIPYNVNNVKITYYGENLCSGHTAGLDLKLYGEFVPGTDSWITLSLMSTGQKVNGKTVPLPTDQRWGVNLHFTDYFPGTEDWKVTLRLAFADGLPFGAPHKGIEYQDFRAPAYKRADLGMSYLAWKNPGRSKSPVKNVWLGMDCLNLFGISNVNSYYWVTDVHNYQYAVPNYLTGRQINVRLQVEL